MMSPGVYIHIPFCKARCSYCAFVSSVDASYMHDYVSALCGEIRGATQKNRAVDTVYIGGGTPSCLYRGALTEIFCAVRDAFDIMPDAEITAEANPESCDGGFIAEARTVGVNRVSLGLQSACDGTLKSIGRLHDVKGFIAAAERVRNSGVDNISSDIILGLPGQDNSDIVRAVKIISDLCDHASVYALSVEEGTPLYKSGYRPDDDIIADMYELACNELYSKGYTRYEVSNFARRGRMSKHNSKYWTGAPYFGFGAGAHGYDGNNTRYRHEESVPAYIKNTGVVCETLSQKDLYNEFVMLSLRTERGLSEDELFARFGSEAAQKQSVIRSLIDSGLLVRGGGRIRISPDKMFVMNGIIEDIMLD